MRARRITTGLILVPLLGACAGGETAPPPATFFEIDSGESTSIANGGRAILSSWHGDTNRQEQVLCVEPPESLGEAAWARFETCLHYLNGLIDLETYRDKANGAAEP